MTAKPSLHAKCGAFLETNPGILICGRSRGHSNEKCYDPGADREFTPQYKPSDKR